MNDFDRPHVTGELMSSDGMIMDRAAWRDRIQALEDAGATELAYQPASPDIPRELEAFAAAVV